MRTLFIVRRVIDLAIVFALALVVSHGAPRHMTPAPEPVVSSVGQ